MVFPDQEDSLWQYDDAAGAWYFHRFYRTQPDLNITDSRVRDEMLKIMGFWIELGISGFRVDAVPFLIDPEGVDARDAAAVRRPARLPARRCGRSWSGGSVTLRCSAR